MLHQENADVLLLTKILVVMLQNLILKVVIAKTITLSLYTIILYKVPFKISIISSKKTFLLKYQC